MPSLDVVINAMRAEAGSKQFDQAVKKIQLGASGVDRSLKQNTKSFQGFGTQMQSMVVGMVSLAAVYKGLRLAQSSLREFAAFESQLANISTMLDKQTMQFLPGYKKELAGLAVEFGQTTETLSKGLYDILSASIGASKAVGVLRVASKAAIGGLTTTAIAADAITTVLNAYSMEAGDASKVSDILFATVKGGKLTFGELASSIGKVAAIAATSGLTLEQVSASIATMTRMGINADMAMTSLKALITSFIAPTVEAAAFALDKFNLTLSANTLQTIGLSGAMELLKNATAEETAAIFPNVRALIGSEATRKNVVALIGDHTKALNSAGAAEEAYQKNAGTLEIQLAKNTQAWKALRIEIITLTITPIRDWFQGSILLTQDLTKALDTLKVATTKAVPSDMADELARIKKQFDPETIKAFNDNLRKTTALYQELTLGLKAPDLTGPLTYEEQLKRIQKSISLIGTVTLPEVKAVGIEDPEAAKKAREEAVNQTEAYRRMYDDLGAMGNASYENRLKLLNFEKEDYATFIDDKILLEQWFNERKNELDLERDMKGDEFQTGFKASIENMQNQMMTWGEIGAQSAQTMKGAFSVAVKDMIMNGATLKEAMHGFAMSMLSSFIDVITQMIAMKIMASAFGVGAPMSGGVPGGGFMGPMKPNAKGNIFNAGVKAFRKGGMIGQPTVFPMANGGVGLAGEAGIEALMPVGRDSQGRMGVHASGESKQPIKIINVVDPSQFEEYLNTGAGERAIMNIMQRNQDGSDNLI